MDKKEFIYNVILNMAINEGRNITDFNSEEKEDFIKSIEEYYNLIQKIKDKK